MEGQREITQSNALPKIDLHSRKRTMLEELFKAPLHKLTTGEIRAGELELTALTATPDGPSVAVQIG